MDSYKDKFESVKVAEPLLGEVGADASAINDDKKAAAEAITAEAVKTAGYDSLDAANGRQDSFCIYGTWYISYSKDFIQPDADTDAGAWL